MMGTCTRSTKKLTSLVIQFFEMVPVRRIQCLNADIDIADLDVEAQRYILSETVNSQHCLDYPPSVQYQRTFVKKLLNTLESCGMEICDELYETYTQLLQQRDGEDENLCYKTYTVNEDVKITIQESVNMISCGTTGLSTWQAAQHLAEWAVQNKSLLENREIVELGSGLGLSGITVCKMCHVNSYTFTDCHTEVLDCLSRNIELNFWDCKLAERCENLDKVNTESNTKQSDDSRCDKHGTGISCNSTTPSDCESGETHLVADCVEGDKMETCVTCELVADCDNSGINTELGFSGSLTVESDEVKGHSDKTGEAWAGVRQFRINKISQCKRVQAVHLDWENVDHSLKKLLSNTDVILAADVVYDTTIIPALVSVLKLFLCNKTTRPVAYIASTIRNEDTRDQFLITLNNEGLKYEPVDPPTLQLFHYDRSLPIEIIRVTSIE